MTQITLILNNKKKCKISAIKSIGKQSKQPLGAVKQRQRLADTTKQAQQRKKNVIQTTVETLKSLLHYLFILKYFYYLFEWRQKNHFQFEWYQYLYFFNKYCSANTFSYELIFVLILPSMECFLHFNTFQ